jgi:acyl-CoA synthetase (AMP-forming)/AMP-acid ligase II
MPAISPERAPGGLTLDGVVSWWAQVRPDEPALRCAIDATPELTWSGFADRVEATAALLGRRIKPDAAVAVVCSTGIELHVLVNALWRAGVAVLLLDRNWGPAIVEDLVRLVDCERIFAPAGWAAAGSAEELVERYPLGPGSADGLDWSPPSPDVDRIALYATTSGTTDNPKCVAISHRKIRSAYDCCLRARDFSGVKEAACLFELNSLGILGVCFLLPREVGAATTIYPTFNIANIAELWATVIDDAPDFVYLVPPLVRLLNALPAVAHSAQGKRVLAFCSAAPVAEAELRKLEARYPLEVYNCYGLTELTFAVFFGCRAHDGGASESIGEALGFDARLLDAEGREIDGIGSGEMQIAGPMLTAGYHRNPEGTAACWDGRWLRTGDIAERDGEGRYRIRGRLKDVVLRGGYTCYLGELEHYLRRVPEVVDVCAFRGRDLPSGDELCVLVQADGRVEPDTLMRWINANLGTAKVPNKLYVSAQALPRNSNGKIDRNRLTRLHLDGALGTGSLA